MHPVHRPAGHRRQRPTVAHLLCHPRIDREEEAGEELRAAAGEQPRRRRWEAHICRARRNRGGRPPVGRHVVHGGVDELPHHPVAIIMVLITGSGGRVLAGGRMGGATQRWTARPRRRRGASSARNIRANITKRARARSGGGTHIHARRGGGVPREGGGEPPPGGGTATVTGAVRDGSR